MLPPHITHSSMSVVCLVINTLKSPLILILCLVSSCTAQQPTVHMTTLAHTQRVTSLFVCVYMCLPTFFLLSCNLIGFQGDNSMYRPDHYHGYTRLLKALIEMEWILYRRYRKYTKIQAKERLLQL